MMATHPETAPYLEAFAARPRHGEPAWLGKARASALERFAALGFPTRREEAWRFTDLRPLERGAFPPAAGTAPSGADVAPWRWTGPSHRVVLIDGCFAPQLSEVGPLPPGAFVGALSQAFESQPALAARAFEDGIEGGPFATLAAAFAGDGFVLALPEGAKLDRPVEIIHVGRADTASFHLRSAVLLAAGSEATLVETHAGDGGHWTNEVLVLRLGPGAALDHVKLQDEGSAIHLGLAHAVLEERARYRSFLLTTGARLSRQDSFVRFAGAGAQVRLDGVSLLTGEREATAATFVDHAAPGCTTRELWKAVVDDRAHGVFLGRIAVREHAQKSDAQQVSRNLLLSRRASVDTKPELEILADDVKCSHGATVGDLDEQQIFYLRSRGLEEPAARRLLVEAFAADAVERVEARDLREHLMRHLARALEGLGHA